MTLTRKLKREHIIQERKAFRTAIKEQVVLNEYQKRFKQGVEVGYKSANEQILDKLFMDGILTNDQFKEYKELTQWTR